MGGGVELEHDVEIAAEQRSRHVGRSAERYDLRLDAGDVLEQLGRKVLRAARIDGADVQLARIALAALMTSFNDFNDELALATINRSKNDTVEVEAKSLRMS